MNRPLTGAERTAAWRQRRDGTSVPFRGNLPKDVLKTLIAHGILVAREDDDQYTLGQAVADYFDDLTGDL